MSTPHLNMEHEQKQSEASTSTHETVPDREASPAPPAPPPTRPRSRRWLVVLVSVLIVLLLGSSVGVIVLTRPGQKLANQTPTPNLTVTTSPASPSTTPTSMPTQPIPPAGQWLQVLTNYHVTELLAAPGQATILYASAVAPGVPVQYRSVETVLRSTDFGATWQDIGKRANEPRL